MSEVSHTLMDGKVHVYRRPESRFWQCSVFLGGRNHRASTGHDNLAVAMEFARDWYLDRYADERLRKRGIPLPRSTAEEQPRHAEKAPAKKATGPTFREAAEAFQAEYGVIKRGVGYCKSMPGAVHPFNRVNIRKKPAQTDLVFGPVQRELLNTVLSEIGLKRDRDGRLRAHHGQSQ